MKFPRVDLYVEGYQTREVAVTGAVQKPGRYDIANRDESIIDMIGRAGGTDFGFRTESNLVLEAHSTRSPERTSIRLGLYHTMHRGRAILSHCPGRRDTSFSASLIDPASPVRR